MSKPKILTDVENKISKDSIINNLTTGGADKVASAETVKILNTNKADKIKSGNYTGDLLAISGDNSKTYDIGLLSTVTKYPPINATGYSIVEYTPIATNAAILKWTNFGSDVNQGKTFQCVYNPTTKAFWSGCDWKEIATTNYINQQLELKADKLTKAFVTQKRGWYRIVEMNDNCTGIISFTGKWWNASPTLTHLSIVKMAFEKIKVNQLQSVLGVAIKKIRTVNTNDVTKLSFLDIYIDTDELMETEISLNNSIRMNLIDTTESNIPVGYVIEEIDLINNSMAIQGKEISTTDKIDSLFERGTWKPEIVTGNATVTYSTQTGDFVKLGKLVRCTFDITCTLNYTQSGGIYIVGLPILAKKIDSGTGVISYSSTHQILSKLMNIVNKDSFALIDNNNIMIQTSSLGTTGIPVNLKGSLEYEVA